MLFFFGAFAVFLYRRTAEITWLRAAVGSDSFRRGAVTTKEHTVVLPALSAADGLFLESAIFLCGYPPKLAALRSGYGGRGSRGPFTWCAAARRSSTAGFGIKDFTWYQYFFTQCRAFWVYIRLFLFPAGLNIDYDFPISRTIAGSWRDCWADGDSAGGGRGVLLPAAVSTGGVWILCLRDLDGAHIVVRADQQIRWRNGGCICPMIGLLVHRAGILAARGCAATQVDDGAGGGVLASQRWRRTAGITCGATRLRCGRTRWRSRQTKRVCSSSSHRLITRAAIAPKRCPTMRAARSWIPGMTGCSSTGDWLTTASTSPTRRSRRSGTRSV